MKLKDFAIKLARLPWFDITTAELVSGMPPEQLRVYLSRWSASGDIVPVRRGLYVFGEPWRRIEPHHLALAQVIQPRSYITAETAAQYHELIPDGVFTQFSATLRRPGKFETPFGYFVYRKINPKLFGGAVAVKFGGGQTAMIATPAKTLIDILYFGRGTWPIARIEGLRLQNLENVNLEEGRQWASKSPRLKRAWRNFEKVYEQETASRS